jgi:GH15 family glucan-1,4-alpha-glucosidase
VRIGNAAFRQRQNDLMGEVVLCLDTLLRDPRLVYEDPDSFFPLVQRLVEQAIAAAPTEDTSIWEFRSMLRPYTFSRAMCWAAIHRGEAIARRFGRRELADDGGCRRPRAEALGRVQSEAVFTQTLDGRGRASNLLLPMIGI